MKMQGNDNHGAARKGLKRGIFVGVWSAIFAIILVFAIVVTSVCSYYDSIITDFFGSIGGSTVDSSDGTDYFRLDYPNADELLAAEDALCRQMGEEAVVLLENDGALPLTKNASVSVFGVAATGGSSVGAGSGHSGGERVDLAGSLTAAGFKVNESLLAYYAANSTPHGEGTVSGDGDSTGDWSLGREADFPTGSELAALDSYGDAAIMVLRRNGSEGGDLPRTMDDHAGAAGEHYLSLSPSEKATLQGIRDCGKFDKIIVLVNSANPLELGGLKDYGVNAVLWYGGLGTTGLMAVGEILAGDVDPSGRLPDTYVYNNFSSPAMQNFGDFRFANDMSYSYVNYAEGIYVGYKYYETRYEDSVMGTGNAGDYRYEDTVLYPFGHGLSYTSFAWSDYACQIENETVNISLTVTNTGSMAGKEVVQIYYQGEYTDFDRVNGIEKAAVNLVEFAKTGVLEPNGGSERVTIRFPLSDLKAYDSRINKTYIC